MENTDLSIAIKFAQENEYRTAEISTYKKWRFFKGVPIFTPVFDYDGDDDLIVGQPQFIIVENSVPRFLTGDEINFVMGIRAMPPDFTERFIVSE